LNEISTFRCNQDEYALDIKAINEIIKCQKQAEVALHPLAAFDRLPVCIG
jgi:chemotaxis signal transduction protein